MEQGVTDAARYKALAVSLRELIRTPGWDSYVKLLEESEARHIEALIQTPDAHGLAGIIQGLRIAYHLPQQIIDRAQSL